VTFGHNPRGMIRSKKNVVGKFSRIFSVDIGCFFLNFINGKRFLEFDFRIQKFPESRIELGSFWIDLKIWLE